MNYNSLSRILPFALFMCVIGLEEGLRFLSTQGWIHMEQVDFTLLYPLRPFFALLALVAFRKYYSEISWKDLLNVRDTLFSMILGIVVFILWIHMDWTFGSMSEPTGFDPNIIQDHIMKGFMICIRIASAALLVPVMEELFWRSFILRYIIKPDFSSVQIGTFTWNSFAICAVLFGLEHNFILAGIMAGIAYSVLLYRTKSIAQCILSHGVTNFVLALYVLHTQQWKFW